MAGSSMASASTMRILLRLPACLRQSVFLERVSQSTANGRHSLNGSPLRTFITSSKNLAKEAARPKPFRKPSHLQPTPAPKATPRTPSTSERASSSLNTIAPELDTVLLYTAPRHGGFFFISYFAGLTLLFGASNTAYTFSKDRPDMPKTPWYIKSMSMAPALFMAIMGTACMLAPMKVIKSLAIVTVDGSRVLRFEIRRALPFRKPDILETPASRVALDRNVRGFTEDLKINNVRLSDVKSFTENYFSKSPQASQESGITGVLSSFNNLLINAWPASKRNIRRMFTRDQMAYIRVEGNGNFKLDLQECSLVEQGKPLERFITIDEGERPSIAGWFTRVFK